MSHQHDLPKLIHNMTSMLTKTLTEITRLCEDYQKTHSSKSHAQSASSAAVSNGKKQSTQQAQVKKPRKPSKVQTEMEVEEKSSEEIQISKPKKTAPKTDTPHKNDKATAKQGSESKAGGQSKQQPPKKPLSSYFIFSFQRKPKILAKFPELSVTELSQVIGQEWGRLDSAQKSVYQAQADQRKKQYEKAFAAFMKRNPGYTAPQKKKKNNHNSNHKSSIKQESVSLGEDV